MTKALNDEDTGTPDEDRYEPDELAWAGRRRRRSVVGLVGSALVLAALVYFTGWHRQVADAQFLVRSAPSTSYVSHAREAVQGLICPRQASLPAAAPPPSAGNLASAGDPNAFVP